MATGNMHRIFDELSTCRSLLTGDQMDTHTRRSVQTVLHVHLKRICSLNTSAFSTIEVLDNNCVI